VAAQDPAEELAAEITPLAPQHELLRVGTRRGEEVEVRVGLRADPLDRRDRPQDEREVGRDLEGEAVEDVGDVVRELLESDLADPKARVVLDELLPDPLELRLVSLLDPQEAEPD